ncbi:MAG: malto-oligosyltrehalose trehalohydrolase [Polyangiaceae bacterium]|nr:malto-oligosyltrehalose trehalohydrolase [Polyangiaceae bacterium]
MTSLAPGAHADADGLATSFVVYSTIAKDVRVRLFDAERNMLRTEPLAPVEPVALAGSSTFECRLEGVGPGALYLFVLDGKELPDPYARSMPFGVHGPAEVVPLLSTPLPALKVAPPLSSWVIYELHIGTFTTDGTFRAAIGKLDELVELGVTAIELLPIAAFPGERGWGYDGVALYAPFAPYGTADDLRALIRAAHARGLVVLLDVVYNHFGPSGNYLACYAPEYLLKTSTTPWGAAPDFTHAATRRLVLDNVRYWFDAFGFDGLRFDATPRIHDSSEIHILAQACEIAHRASPPRRIFFEDARNDPDMMKALGTDGVWADDFHHQVHVLLTGERDGYYASHQASLDALAQTIRQGWFYQGEPYAYWGGRVRGKLIGDTLPEALLYCIQNHDQIGNRALGDRLSALVDTDTYCAAAALLLFLPMTPLLFMGEEWGASSPFLFFSDLDGEAGQGVLEGRRAEFRDFVAFAEEAARDKIPDPQARATLLRSKLDWSERGREPHARVLGTYRMLLHLRRTDPVLSAQATFYDLDVLVEDEMLIVYRSHAGQRRCLIVNFTNEAHEANGVRCAPLTNATLLYATNEQVQDTKFVPPRSAVIFSVA